MGLVPSKSFVRSRQGILPKAMLVQPLAALPVGASDKGLVRVRRLSAFAGTFNGLRKVSFAVISATMRSYTYRKLLGSTVKGLAPVKGLLYFVIVFLYPLLDIRRERHADNVDDVHYFKSAPTPRLHPNACDLL